MVKLDCEIYAPGKRAATTEKQHEAIKNCELTSLDLLVREMVQNSLDAALDEDVSKTVSVYFTRGKFDVEAFAKSLGKEKTFGGANFAKLLLEYVKRTRVEDRYLAIRDIGCVGLDGEVSDKKSRAWKLPFGFFDGQQSDSTTGGANGVGKVVAFRFGIGFVVYYSKTKDGRSRFVIAFMDDGTHNVFPRQVMPDGAAWWGRRSRAAQLGVVCAEKESEVLELLQIFKIKPYPKGRSGTTIIIPFFDESKCLKEGAERFPVELCPWVRDFDSYLRFCTYQWYAPRIRGDVTVVDPESLGDDAPYHWGRGLKVQQTVRNADAMSTKLFSLIRDLYDVAVGEKKPDKGIRRITCPKRRNSNKLDITFKGENFGWVAVKKINFKTGEYAGLLPTLCALVPGHVDSDEGDSFTGRLGSRRGFMLYCRRHGMIISYEKDWDDICYSSLPRPQDGEVYIGIFVVDSLCTVKAPQIQNESNTASIDVMFRSFEKTDHYGWPRRASFGRLPIVEALLKQIKAKLATEFRGCMSSLEREPLDRLSTLLGRFVSTSGVGFGEGPNPSPEGVGGVPGVIASRGGGGLRAGGRMGHGGSGGGSGKLNSRIRFVQGAPVYAIENHHTVVSIPVTITFSQKGLCAGIRCGIAQDGNNAVLFAEDFRRGDFPVTLDGVEVVVDGDDVTSYLNKKDMSAVVRATRKMEVTVICKYGLARKDTALVLDCKQMEGNVVL